MKWWVGKEALERYFRQSVLECTTDQVLTYPRMPKGDGNYIVFKGVGMILLWRCRMVWRNAFLVSTVCLRLGQRLLVPAYRHQDHLDLLRYCVNLETRGDFYFEHPAATAPAVQELVPRIMVRNKGLRQLERLCWVLWSFRTVAWDQSNKVHA